MLSKELQNIDRTLVTIATQLNLLKLVNPINLQEEKERFFANSNYNPQFKYNINFSQLLEIEKKLLLLEIDKRSWQGILLNEVRDKFVNDCNFVKQIGGEINLYKEVNQKKYISKFDLKDEEILDLTEQELAKEKLLNSETIYDAKCVQEIFVDFLKKKEIQWKIVINKDLIPLLSVNYFNQEIQINPLIQLSQIQVERMLIHEIETHLYRYLNGKNLFKMASFGLNNYEKTEEGLAAYNESLVFPEDKSYLKRFYLRYKSVLFGEKNSFRKLYQYLHEEFKFDQEESWRTALRVKRGIADTSEIGAFLKDKIYLQGFFAVRNLKMNEIKTLYKGKFSLEYLNSKQFNLDDDNLIALPQYLPSIYKKFNV